MFKPWLRGRGKVKTRQKFIFEIGSTKFIKTIRYKHGRSRRIKIGTEEVIGRLTRTTKTNIKLT